MVDLLPDQTGLWQHVEALAQEHFRRSGLQEIRTPVLEATQLFARGIGEATDVVGKEMYTFEDRSHRSCTLRPEGTAAVVRAAIQYGLLTQGPQRLWYGGPMFRYERPQAGRQRQFHQIGVELLGFSDPLADVEGIAVAWDFLTSLGLQGLTLEVNTLGTEDDRAHYQDQLVSFLQSHYDALDQDSQERLLRNPLRILDSKHPSTQALLAQAPTLESVLSRHSQHRFRQVLAGLRALGIPHQINPRLVRGLDYYSHTAFEITSTQLGAQATVCGGGRYDGLVSQLGGPSTAAFGWALGMERLVLLLNHADNYHNPHPIPSLYVIHRGEVASLAALVLVRNLRLHGLHVELDPGGAAFSKQFKRADRSGAPWAAVLAEEEIAKHVVQLKPLRGQSDPSVQLPLGDLSPLLDKLSQ